MPPQTPSCDPPGGPREVSRKLPTGRGKTTTGLYFIVFSNVFGKWTQKGGPREVSRKTSTGLWKISQKPLTPSDPAAKSEAYFQSCNAMKIPRWCRLHVRLPRSRRASSCHPRLRCTPKIVPAALLVTAVGPGVEYNRRSDASAN